MSEAEVKKVKSSAVQKAYERAHVRNMPREVKQSYLQDAAKYGGYSKELERVGRETAERVRKETAERVEKETAERVEKETAERVRRETAERVGRETAERVGRETAERVRRETAKEIVISMLAAGMSEAQIANGGGDPEHSRLGGCLIDKRAWGKLGAGGRRRVSISSEARGETKAEPRGSG